MKLIFNQSTLEAWKDVDASDWQSLVLDLASFYLEVSPEQYAQLCQAWEKRDHVELKGHAEALKATCGNIGAEAAHTLLTRIEYFAGKGRFNELSKLMEDLDTVMQKTETAVNNFLATVQAT